MSHSVASDSYATHGVRAAVDAAELQEEQGKRQDLYRFLSLSEVEQLPKPSFLIDDVIPKGGLGVLYGPPGAGKTFLALHLGLCVGCARSFFGHPSQRGAVLYIAAEGTGGMGARVRAWREAHGQLFGIRFMMLPEAVQLMEPAQMTKLAHTIDQSAERVELIIIDTFARCFLGGEENSAKDMGIAIAALDALRRRTKAAVLLVHHTRKDGDQERGSIALRGAADTMIAVKDADGRLVLTCDKQKEAEPFREIRIELVRRGDSLAVATPKTAPGITKSDLEILAALDRCHIPISSSDWLKASAKPDSTFFLSRGKLLKLGLTVQSREGSGQKYAVTPDGSRQLAEWLPPMDSSSTPKDADIRTESSERAGGDSSLLESPSLGLTVPGSNGVETRLADSNDNSNSNGSSNVELELEIRAEIDHRLGMKTDR